MISDRFHKNESLSRHTNFRIGGPAKYFFEAKTSDEIIEAVKWATDNGEKFFVLGGGSNTLVSDKGFDGLIIKTANRDIEIHGNRVIAGAGALSALVARKTAEAGLTGFEWAISLPGTIGGAVRGNAGCFGGEIKDALTGIKIFTRTHPFADSRESANGTEWSMIELKNAECEFAYRDSIFKHMDPASVILSAELTLKKDDSVACRKRVEENLKKRKEKQPLESSSAGCIFKNYLLLTTHYSLNSEIPQEFLNSKIVPAGWLIEHAGLGGLCIGDAEISKKHGNFMLNRGKATAEDIYMLIQKVKTVVREKFNIALQEEVQYVGFEADA